MTAQSPSPALDSPHAVFDRYVRAGLSGDRATQVGLFAVDGVLEFPFAPPGSPRRVEGREQIRRVVGGNISPAGLRVDEEGSTLVVHETTDPEVIVVEAEVHSEVVSTGARFMVPYVQVYQVRSGEILLLRDYWPAWAGPAVSSALATGGPPA
ncbi:nuclear transport factor 2 family protein [Pseudofrankia inefficax]|uniref:SnoaL-like domain-containing protein n=1 Tax=Pseudofrankia inefficax (strain DSM 45817 / CECT 9037 / DDB 130130 / EuI1c) TaxID=298654 RepID=E3JAQ0_PSEI1|nr:nuclear transport factor 2 family protein [Pseudofrankia inefficax]ADP82242.1 hypothetical protein FraEuI1c_4243 [Pseudofrankia inefficax]